MRMPHGCGRLSGKIVKLLKSLYGLKQASRQWHSHLCACLVLLGFVRCEADTCVFRLMEDGKVVIAVVVHVDDLFAAGAKERCDQFGRDLREKVPVKNLGELHLYAGCVYDRNKQAGLLTISHQTFAETLVAEYGVGSRKMIPLSANASLHDVDGQMDARASVHSWSWLGL
ncbi:unnamed protein product [Pylaiella littoralis]